MHPRPPVGPDTARINPDLVDALLLLRLQRHYDGRDVRLFDSRIDDNGTVRIEVEMGHGRRHPRRVGRLRLASLEHGLDLAALRRRVEAGGIEGSARVWIGR